MEGHFEPFQAKAHTANSSPSHIFSVPTASRLGKQVFVKNLPSPSLCIYNIRSASNTVYETAAKGHEPHKRPVDFSEPLSRQSL